MSLQTRLRTQSEETKRRAAEERLMQNRIFAAKLAEASIARSEAFESVKAKALEKVQQLKDVCANADPMSDQLAIAHAQGGIKALVELIAIYEQAARDAALIEKQTTGQ